MLELYIGENQMRADLREDARISLTYNAIDTENPSKERAGYSKTVELDGTPANNRIFTNFHLLDTVVGDFNPRRRVPYVLRRDGELVEQGYLSLDNVKRDRDGNTFSITLYSGIGDFFYNLVYDDEGNERRLYDLHFGFNTPNEDEDVLMYWNAETIVDGWNDVMSYDTSKEVTDLIKGCPVYNGYPEDMDSDVVAVKYDELSQSDKTLVNQGKGADYGPLDGWVVTTATRDLDPFEAKDLRSSHIRPCARLWGLLDAISNPINNGGYNVIWDDEIKDVTSEIGETMDNAFILFDNIDFDGDEAYESLIEGHLSDLNIYSANYPNLEDGEFVTYVGSEATFSTQNMLSPRYEVNVMERVQLLNGQKANSLSTCSYFKVGLMEGEKVKEYDNTVMGGWGIWLEVYDNDVLSARTPVHFVRYLPEWETVNLGTRWGMLFGGKLDDMVASALGVTKDNIIYEDIPIVPSGDTRPTPHLKWQRSVKLGIDLWNSSSLKVKVCKKYVAFNYLKDIKKRTSVWYGLLMRDPNSWNCSNMSFSAHTDLYNTDDGRYANGAYDGSLPPTIQKMAVTKRMLLSADISPYELLVGLARAFDLRFLLDADRKEVRVLMRKHYYMEGIKDIGNDISIDDGYEITPNLVESKWYKYGFQDADTYASYLYSKRNRIGYGDIKVDTGYQFNKITTDLFSDIPYQDVIPYCLNSIFFNDRQGPRILNAPTIDIKWFNTGDTGTTQETTVYGDAHYTRLYKIFDKPHRLCCFGDENDTADVAPALILYDGTSSSATDRGMAISDNLPIMWDLNGSPCYLWSPSGYGVAENGGEETRVCWNVNGLPHFSKYIVDTNTGAYIHSLDFAKPAMTFIRDDYNYGDGITLYSRYWKKFIESIYHPEARKVRIKMFIRERPQDALRRIYRFEHSLWVISSITDYDPSGESLTSVEFVKILSYDSMF